MSQNNFKAGLDGRTTIGTEAFDPQGDELTSVQRAVALGSGFEVNEAGRVIQRYYPDDNGVVALATGNTITPVAEQMLVSIGSAATGLIIAAGSKFGQKLRLINVGGASGTFAVFGTSRVLDGGNQRLLSYSQQEFTWVRDQGQQVSAWVGESTK